MNKEVIYIDVDDDVTAIIGKIKKSKDKIVALVPPKRVGVLQSAVNLRLLDRMAKEAKKKLVLVTNNQALIALAANAAIPVAKNLQSKPEVAEIPALAIDEDDDIIDGAELPIGDHAGDIEVKDGTRLQDVDEDVIKGIDVSGQAKKNPPTNKIKIPDFNAFRKKFLLIALGVLLLGAGLVWAFVFAPAATVVITARTTPMPISTTATLGVSGGELEKGVIGSITKQEKKDISVEFEATGRENIGDKAIGTVRFSTPYISSLGTIPAGTKLTTSSGYVFATDEAVVLTTGNFTGVNVGMTAVVAGDDYNNRSGSMSGAPSGVSATIVGSTSGGTTDMARVVSGDDIERARGQLQGRNFDDEKEALMAQFTQGERVIDSSFTTKRGDEVLSPKQGERVEDGEKAKLTIPTTFTITAIPQTELDAFLTTILEETISEDNQFIYNNGAEQVEIGAYEEGDDGATVTVVTTGRVGPKIDESTIKEQVKGKRYGEVQDNLQSLSGVQAVDIRFSYFWVRTVPNNTDKITIEFQVQDE